MKPFPEPILRLQIAPAKLPYVMCLLQAVIVILNILKFTVKKEPNGIASYHSLVVLYHQEFLCIWLTLTKY